MTLDTFAGPLDLLWYLVRKHELDPLDIPIAKVAEQYLEILATIEQIDVDFAGDFVDLATRLMEIKSRMMLPRHEELEEEQIEDPRTDLVQRLLEYKKFKDAAAQLEERSSQWQLRFQRQANDAGVRDDSEAEQPVEQIEIWDLVSAFGRVLRDKGAAKSARIVHDDTPIERYMEIIEERIAREAPVAFSSLFEAGSHRRRLAGVFLAVLELIRKQRISVQQDEPCGEIWISPPSAPVSSVQIAADPHDSDG